MHHLGHIGYGMFNCFVRGGNQVFWKKGVFWKEGSFQKSPFSRDSREFVQLFCSGWKSGSEKGGLLEKGSFQKSPFSRDSREFVKLFCSVEIWSFGKGVFWKRGLLEKGSFQKRFSTASPVSACPRALAHPG